MEHQIEKNPYTMLDASYTLMRQNAAQANLPQNLGTIWTEFFERICTKLLGLFLPNSTIFNI